MEINKDEIKEIKKIGKLNGSDVKIITLKGGFHIGMGKKEKDSKKNDILAVGSHPALVSHQISKKYNSKFEENLAKNESETMPSVVELSDILNSKEKNVLGLDIYMIKKNESVEFKVTKHNFEIFSINAEQNCDELLLKNTDKNEESLKNLDKKSLSNKLQKTIKKYADKNNLRVKIGF